MKSVHLIAVFAENKPGQLEQITRVLAAEKINIRLVTFAISEKFGVVKLLVDHTDRAFRVLRQGGWTVSRVVVLALEVPDRPGGLHAVADCLARHDVNVENSSGFVANRRAVLLVEVQALARARRVLAREKFLLLSREDLLAL
jgi:hypothetical protein